MNNRTELTSQTRGKEHPLLKKSRVWIGLLRSAIALFLGFLAIVLFPFWTNEALHTLALLSSGMFGIYDMRSNLLLLTNNSLFVVLGSYIAASLAPHYPMRHALALGVVELTRSIWIVIFRATTNDMGPVWYATTLAVTALPCAWLGGFLRRRQPAEA